MPLYLIFFDGRLNQRARGTRVPAGFLQIRFDENLPGDPSVSTESEFLKVFAAVNKYVCQSGSCSIDDIVEHLVTQEL